VVFLLSKPLSVLVAGCGHMGSSHASAYEAMDGFEIAGLVSRSPGSREELNRRLNGEYPLFDDFVTALESTRPDVVSINTYPDTHEAFAVQAFDMGCHVFLEKPAAPTIQGCRRVISAAKKAKRKLVVGYILNHHPTWIKFVEMAKTLGKPLVMRMDLNRQSAGTLWQRHQNLMNRLSPIVDAGVHYVDIMCRISGADPVRVSAVGARLSEALIEGMNNFGQLQVTFDDGSVGLYESGWGPMMGDAETSFRDVTGPEGSVRMTRSQEGRESLTYHRSALDNENRFVYQDEIIDRGHEPTHVVLCRSEQEFLLKAIQEDLDLSDHHNDVMNSLRIVLEADESIRTGKTVFLK
jgi:predicted dehydrogenase